MLCRNHDQHINVFTKNSTIPLTNSDDCRMTKTVKSNFSYSLHCKITYISFAYSVDNSENIR